MRFEIKNAVLYFADKPMSKGTIVQLKKNKRTSGTIVGRYDGSGTPVGVLLNDVVEIDLTKYHPNWNNDEVVVGGRVHVMSRGTIICRLSPSLRLPIAPTHLC